MKYELTSISKKVGQSTVYRIKALKTFSDVKVGDLGGWVSSYRNLSQDGDCWVYDDAIISGSGYVGFNATVRHNAKVNNKAHIIDFAQVADSVTVGGQVRIRDRATVMGDVKINDNTIIYNRAFIQTSGYIYGDTTIGGHTQIIEGWVDIINCNLTDRVCVSGATLVNCSARDHVKIFNGNLTGVNARNKMGFDKCYLWGDDNILYFEENPGILTITATAQRFMIDSTGCFYKDEMLDDLIEDLYISREERIKFIKVCWAAAKSYFSI